MSIDGTVFHKAGLITGGQGSNTARHWDEKDIEGKRKLIVGLKRKREELQTRLLDISKSKRQAVQDEQIVGEISQLEAKITQLQEEISIVNQKIESCDIEIAHYNGKIENTEAELLEVNEKILDDEVEARDIDQEIEKVENRIFRDFCKEIKMPTIRDYENRTLKGTQASAEKSLKLSTAKAKLENMLNDTND